MADDNEWRMMMVYLKMIDIWWWWICDAKWKIMWWSIYEWWCASASSGLPQIAHMTNIHIHQQDPLTENPNILPENRSLWYLMMMDAWRWSICDDDGWLKMIDDLMMMDDCDDGWLKMMDELDDDGCLKMIDIWWWWITVDDGWLKMMDEGWWRMPEDDRYLMMMDNCMMMDDWWWRITDDDGWLITVSFRYCML